MTPPAADAQVQQRLQAAKAQHHGLPGSAGMLGNPGVIGAPLGPKGQGSSGTGSTGGTPVAAAYYPSPTLQSHYEQLGKLSRLFPPRFFCRVIELWRPRFIP